MANTDSMSKNNFFYPRSRYYGDFKPETLAFNANLQEFAQKVGYISNLHTAGKLSSEQAYEQVRTLWSQLKQSQEAMKIIAIDGNLF